MKRVQNDDGNDDFTDNDKPSTTQFPTYQFRYKNFLVLKCGKR